MQHFKYLFVVAFAFYAHTNATTNYIIGTEIPNGKTTTRTDTIYVGNAGGFNGYEPPSTKCAVLHIKFASTINAAAANTSEALYSSLPVTVKEVWIEGDATGYNTLVSSGVDFALPTPAKNTLVRFFLTNAPAGSPLGWFRAGLPEGCQLSIEPSTSTIPSADPYIETVLPLLGGIYPRFPRVYIGATVRPGVGFSGLLASAAYPVVFQRHPNLASNLAYTAPLVLDEAVTFNGTVNGISLDWKGAVRGEDDLYQISFGEESWIEDPTTAAGQAGFNIAVGKTLKIYNSDKSTLLPPIYSMRAAGGANVEIDTENYPLAPQQLPVISFPKYS